MYRVPVEMSAGVSLIPLHSVTASALLTSLLSLSNQNWSCLSEGMPTCVHNLSLPMNLSYKLVNLVYDCGNVRVTR